jgi:hypothetical protein
MFCTRSDRYPPHQNNLACIVATNETRNNVVRFQNNCLPVITKNGWSGRIECWKQRKRIIQFIWHTNTQIDTFWSCLLRRFLIYHFQQCQSCLWTESWKNPRMSFMFIWTSQSNESVCNNGTFLVLTHDAYARESGWIKFLMQSSDLLIIRDMSFVKFVWPIVLFY